MLWKNAIVATGLILSGACVARGETYTVYTNLAAWQAAAGTSALENFNSQSVGNFAATFNVAGFNNFSLSGNNGGDNVGIVGGAGTANLDATNYLGWGEDPGGNGSAGPTITFNFTQ